MLLRVNFRKYQNSAGSRQILSFFIFCPNDSYGKLFSKIKLKSSPALYFFNNNNNNNNNK